ncbi:glutathione S-transferase N-terminal domain-containing protein [Kiloniella antarctica]|uniref:Glutathione S-transferase N-terminal domain-containing protein n=1 Tax=Kiloniella antarctica TaxID=1550907 RepID=A0ABW5BPM9_9PROT
MLDLFYAPTPNGHKVTLLLEEIGIPYRITPINIMKDDQFNPDFLAIAPNNRIPALVDHDPLTGNKAMPLFESGAILEYLADKYGQFLPKDGAERYKTLQWLHWQMGGLGPMAGQNHHFGRFAPEQIPYAISRYVKETARLYGVLDKQLEDRDYITGAYSIADMAAYPWVAYYEWQQQDLDDFPNLKKWVERITTREATARAYARAEEAFDWDKGLEAPSLTTLKEAAAAIR